MYVISMGGLACSLGCVVALIFSYRILCASVRVFSGIWSAPSPSLRKGCHGTKERVTGRDLRLFLCQQSCFTPHLAIRRLQILSPLTHHHFYDTPHSTPSSRSVPNTNNTNERCRDAPISAPESFTVTTSQVYKSEEVVDCTLHGLRQPSITAGLKGERRAKC